MSSTFNSFGRCLSAVTPQQYIVPDFAFPPYSSHTPGHDGQVGSNTVKSSKACDTNPVTSTSLWLYAAGSLLSWQIVTVAGCPSAAATPRTGVWALASAPSTSIVDAHPNSFMNRAFHSVHRDFGASRAHGFASTAFSSDSRHQRCRGFRSHRTPPVTSTRGKHQTSTTRQINSAVSYPLRDENHPGTSLAVWCRASGRRCHQAEQRNLSLAVNAVHWALLIRSNPDRRLPRRLRGAVRA